MTREEAAESQPWRHTPVIPAIPEAEALEFQDRDQPEKLSESQSQKIKRAGCRSVVGHPQVQCPVLQINKINTRSCRGRQEQRSRS